jgi:hypothetical protein
MGKYTVRHEHTVLGTDRTLWLKEMSSVTASEYRKSSLAMIVPEGDKEPASPEELRAMQLETLRAHVYVEKVGPSLEWESVEAMESEEAGLSAAQLNHMLMAHLQHSGFTQGVTETASRFPDGAGEAGSVPDPPDGRGRVRKAE